MADGVVVLLGAPRPDDSDTTRMRRVEPGWPSRAGSSPRDTRLGGQIRTSDHGMPVSRMLCMASMFWLEYILSKFICNVSGLLNPNLSTLPECRNDTRVTDTHTFLLLLKLCPKFREALTSYKH